MTATGGTNVRATSSPPPPVDPPCPFTDALYRLGIEWRQSAPAISRSLKERQWRGWMSSPDRVTDGTGPWRVSLEDPARRLAGRAGRRAGSAAGRRGGRGTGRLHVH